MAKAKAGANPSDVISRQASLAVAHARQQVHRVEGDGRQIAAPQNGFNSGKKGPLLGFVGNLQGKQDLAQSEACAMSIPGGADAVDPRLRTGDVMDD